MVSLRHRLHRQLQRWIPVLRGPLPLTVPGRRILLPPSGFGLFYAVLVLVMTLGALNYGNNPALLLALLLGGSGLVSLLQAQLQLSGLSLAAMQALPVHAGQPLQVQIHLTSIGDRPRHGLQAGWRDQLPVALQPDLTVSLSLPTERRGLQTVPVMQLTSGWPLGLVTASVHFQPTVSLLVYPHPEPGAPPLPGQTDPNGLQPQADADISHLRDYRAGDSLSQIAWKASARRGQWLVGHRQAGTSPVLQLDWAQLPHLPVEPRISRLTGWVIEARRQQRRWSLHLPGGMVIGPDSGSAHADRCLAALALLPGGDTE